MSGKREIHPSGESRRGRRLASAAVLVWFAVLVLLCLTPVTDQDLGFHIAWGRILQRDFSGARNLLLGQDPSVTLYATSYWLYQETVATLYDHAGVTGLVLFRTLLVLGALTLAFGIARRLRASLASRALLVAFAVLAAKERFVDRPDVFSHVAFLAALWILLFHRRDRGVWALPVLTLLWVNTHMFWSLAPALVVAFGAGDLWEARADRNGTTALPRTAGLRRTLLLLGLVLAASLLNPAGPRAWLTQAKLAGIVGGTVSPILLSEHVSPYSSYRPFLALWVYRVGLPFCLALAFLGRRRIGWGAFLALLIPTVLSLLARRAMSLFAVTAAALVPAALDEAVVRWNAFRARTRPSGNGFRIRTRPSPIDSARVLLVAGLGLVLAAGLVFAAGLVNGRVFLAEDKDQELGAISPLRFPATDAARFLSSARIEGPIFHNPTSAGAILMENGTRLAPFLDPRWCGTEEANRVYVEAVRATPETIAETWTAIERRHGFEAVLLDFYEMPALVRHLAGAPDWARVYDDDQMVLFCRRSGRNDAVIAVEEPRLAAARPRPDAAREEELGREVVRFLGSRPPSLFSPLRFPWSAFRRANLALLLEDRPAAQEATLELFREERGALHRSAHRSDILGNTLWCLAESEAWEARALLCRTLAGERGVDPARRRALWIAEAQAFLRAGRAEDADAAARSVVEDPAAGAEERGWALAVRSSIRRASPGPRGAE